ncbi:copper amine oxidase [Apiospora arundinis]
MASVPESPARPHPLQRLNDAEILKAKDILAKSHESGEGLRFRFTYLEEPKREDLVKYLAAEHQDVTKTTTTLPNLPRMVKFVYDVIKGPGDHTLADAVVDIDSGEVVHKQTHPTESQAGYAPFEFGEFQDACANSDLFKEALKEFELPLNFTITIDPWPYGGLDPEETIPRYMQGLVFARDASKDSLDANHYAYPLPIIPVMDFNKKELIRIDRLATGGKGDPLEPTAASETPKKLFANSKSAEYVPELMDRPLRTDMKPINITQPDGASFTVEDSSLVSWQKWRFRVGFSPREGAVLHDLCYDNRPIFYRMSFSEMTVPYGDPRPPFHRKQAFDFGDGGAGRSANNLALGCDCLGAIHYFDAWDTDPEGKPTLAENVVCLHEQDAGIGWKHTNFRTGRAVVTRMRELVVQFIITLANYEYIFAYKLDTAGNVTLETRATGIVSVVGIDEGKTSGYGNIVSPGVLAQNHQHIFAARLDPAVDSYEAGETAVVLEESHPMPHIDPATNPFGNGYEIRRTPLDKAAFADAEPKLNRVVRLENRSKTNAVSGKHVGYKFAPSPTQLLLAHPDSTQAKRAPFAQHHLWVTGHRDGELWAAGEFTNQSRHEVGGVKAMVERGDWFAKEGEATTGNAPAGEGKLSTPVIWTVFGLTHNPRVEDWPVMPVEIHQVHIRPADFFTSNPALDVPSTKNETSVLVSGSSCCDDKSKKATTQQEEPVSHMQGSGPDVKPKDIGSGNGNGSGGKEKKRLTTLLSGVFGSKKD